MIYENIKSLIRFNPKLRNKQNDLVYSYWVLYDHIEKPEDILKATPAETITRTYRNVSRELELAPLREERKFFDKPNAFDIIKPRGPGPRRTVC